MNITLREGFTVRPASLADVGLLVDLLNIYYKTTGLIPMSANDLSLELEMSGFDIAASTLIVQSPDGRIAGFIRVRDNNPPPVFPAVSGCVHPDFERQGIGTYLLQWAEVRSRQAIAKVPEGIRVAMRLNCVDRHQPTIRLLAKNHFIPVRATNYMLISLELQIPQAKWPEGIDLKTFKELPDLRAIYRANDEAFRDHWGHVERDEDRAVAEWQTGISKDPFFDPSLYFLAVDGADITGICLCRSVLGSDTNTAYVMDLAVRRPWRKRGIALNLLYHAFSEFKNRGKKQVGLHADTQNLTGAVRVYLRSGMHIDHTVTQYEKELRGGRDISTQTLV